MNESKGAIRAVHYGRSFGPFGSELCHFDRGGNSFVHLSYNYDQKPELGFWRGSITDAQFDELVRLMQAVQYDQTEPRILDYPGQEPLSLGEYREGEEDPNIWTYPLDAPELKPIVQLIAELIAQARKTPVRVLRGQARWATPELHRGSFEVQLTLENIGVEPFLLTNPSDPGTRALTVFFHVPSGLEQRGYVHLYVADATPSATEPIIVFAPGERRTFRARGSVPVEPGEYRGNLVFESEVEHGEVAAMQRQLVLDLGPVTVRADAAHEDDEPLGPPTPRPSDVLPPLPPRGH